MSTCGYYFVEQDTRCIFWLEQFDAELLFENIRGVRNMGHISNTLLKLSTGEVQLITLFDVPSFAKLHASTPIHLTVRNRHSSRSANVSVTLDVDPSDAFIVAGSRNDRLPILLPGSEEKLLWKLISLSSPIPISLCNIIRILISELTLHVLAYVDDPRTLARASQVCKRWHDLVANDWLWNGNSPFKADESWDSSVLSP
ncbi:hypothetical protein P692DRAFT_201872440 [Suillus brevipes Sb2]|nr:hypothetical protein P692DRAFT_201872440 [Suillus brevipes Sb2]